MSISYDSAGKNAYLYNDPTDDQPFRFVPWDFNHSWGQDWRTFRTRFDNDEDLTGTNAIFAHLLWGDPESLIARYAQMRIDGPLTDSWLIERIDGYWQQLTPSIERDWAKWSASHQSYSSWASTRSAYGDWTTPDEERTYLEEWIEARGDFLDTLLEED